MTRLKTNDIALSISKTELEEWTSLSPNIISRSSIAPSFVNKNRIIRRRLDNNKSVFTNLTSGITFEHDITYDLMNSIKPGLTSHVVRNAELIDIPCRIQNVNNGNIVIAITSTDEEYINRLRNIFAVHDVYNIQVISLIWLNGFNENLTARATVYSSFVFKEQEGATILLNVKNSIERDTDFNITNIDGYITLIGYRFTHINTVTTTWSNNELTLSIANDIDRVELMKLIEKQYIHIGSIARSEYVLENGFPATGFARTKRLEIDDNRIIFDNVDQVLQNDFIASTDIDILFTDYSTLPGFKDENYISTTYDLELDYGDTYRYIENNILIDTILRVVAEGKATCTLSFEGINTETDNRRTGLRIDTDRHSSYTTSLEIARIRLYDEENIYLDFQELTITFTTPSSQKRTIGKTTFSQSFALGTSISISGTLVIADFTIAEKLQNSKLLSMDLILSNYKDGVIVFDFPSLQFISLEYTYNADQSITASIQAEAKALEDILHLSYIAAPVLPISNRRTVDIFPQFYTGNIADTSDSDRYRFTIVEPLIIDSIITGTARTATKTVRLELYTEDGQLIHTGTRLSASGAIHMALSLLPGSYYIDVNPAVSTDDADYNLYIDNIPIYLLSSTFIEYTQQGHISIGGLYVNKFELSTQSLIFIKIEDLVAVTSEGYISLRIARGDLDDQANTQLYEYNSIGENTLFLSDTFAPGVYTVYITHVASRTDTDFTLTTRTILDIPDLVTERSIRLHQPAAIANIRTIYFSVSEEVIIQTIVTNLSLPWDISVNNLSLLILSAQDGHTPDDAIETITTNFSTARPTYLARRLAIGSYFIAVHTNNTDTFTDYDLSVELGSTPETLEIGTPIVKSGTLDTWDIEIMYFTITEELDVQLQLTDISRSSTSQFIRTEVRPIPLDDSRTTEVISTLSRGADAVSAITTLPAGTYSTSVYWITDPGITDYTLTIEASAP